jgi:ribosomal-protein-alanine N-acetyltransferase
MSIPNRPTLRTPRNAITVGTRVYLRKLRAADREEYVQRMIDSRAMHGRYVNPMTKPSDFDALIPRLRQTNRLMTAACLRDTHAIVGAINLNEIVRGITQTCYIGYQAFTPYDSKGLMTESLALILTHAFRDLKLHRVEAGIQPENIKSIALVQRLGFRYEGLAKRLIKIQGRWRDHQRWAILAEEWKPSKVPYPIRKRRKP